MRTCLFAMPVWCCALAALAAPPAEEGAPYLQYVSSDGVFVRSGPGKDYYPTEKLDRGTPVEVHRRDPGGWCAIRPPEGSFSWVSSRYLRTAEAGLGIVSGEEVVARVGSRLSNVRDVIQVRLEKGEEVEILGETNSGGQSWYKIAPPAGEFRWISSRYLSDTPPDEEVAQPRNRNSAAGSGERASRTSSRRPIRSASYEELDEAADEEYLDEEEALAEDEYADEADYEEPRETRPRSSRSVRLAGNDDSLRPSSRSGDKDSRSKSRSKPTPGLGKGADFDHELSAIDAEISRQLAQEPGAWEFDDLHGAVDVLHDAAHSATERGLVRKLQRKLDHLEDIRDRHLASADVRTGLAGLPVGGTTASLPPRRDYDDRTFDHESEEDSESGLGATLSRWRRSEGERARRTADAARTALTGALGDPAANPNTAPPAAATSAAAGYDGQGELRQVISKQREAPKFALVGPDGEVQSFVSPAPGVDLQRYVGQRVGLSGSRGFMPALKKQHLLARQVTVIDGNLQR